jgi:predicted HTH domain antitoxin
MRTFAITYSETIPAMGNLSPEVFETEARMAMAIKLYELGRLTSGQAVELAGISRATFLLSCHQFGTASVEWDQAELDAEFRLLISLIPHYSNFAR